MFGDTFETPEDVIYDAQASLKRREQSCADALPQPDPPRERHFAGIKNQGATCYLNSLIQSCYICPEFRNNILALQLCKDTISQPSDLITNLEKHKFLLEWQKLFIKLRCYQVFAVTTEELTKSFGWEGNEHFVQQDVSEANRVLFEAIDKALLGTPYNISEYYRGITSNYITCHFCQSSHGRDQVCYDLNLMVLGNKTLHDAIMAFITPEQLNGNNKYMCEVCMCKQDAEMGVKLKKLPPILQFSLNRFTFNREIMQRVKVNDRFEFPLELDMSPYMAEDRTDLIYDLCAVIIHQGNAFGGHYHAYFRDLLDEAEWKVQMAMFWHDKSEQNKAKAEKTKEQTQEQVQQPPPQSQEVECTLEDPIGLNFDEYERDIKAPPPQPQAPDVDYDEEAFPFESTNPAVYSNWFDFDDQSVRSIPFNRLQKQFQGAESAYILIYRLRTLVPQKEINIPAYLQSYVNELNEKLAQERAAYEEAKNWIQVRIVSKEYLDMENRVLLTDKYPYQEFKLRLDSKVEELIGEKKCTLVEFVENYYSKLLQFPRSISDFGKTLKESEIMHQSTWILVEDIENWVPYIGIDKVPFKLKLIHNKKQIPTLVYVNNTVSEVKERIYELTGVPAEEQILKNLLNQEFIQQFPNNMTLNEIRLSTEHQIQVTQKQVSEAAQGIQPKVNAPANDDLISVLVERDDVQGCNKFYTNLEITLQELIDFLKNQLGLTDQRRLRNLFFNRIYCQQELGLQLKSLEGFKDGGVRLSLEKGSIPESGKITLRVKCKSKHTGIPNALEDVHVDPFLMTVADVKVQACQKFDLDPQLHRLYKSDWCEDPVQALSREEIYFCKAEVKERDLLILCDLDNRPHCDLNYFNVFLTKTGQPDDQQQQQRFAVKKDSTVMELKQNLIMALDLKCTPGRLRVREINRFYFFSTVLRRPESTMTKMNFQTKNLVVQVLENDENLSENDILLILKRRDAEKRIYHQGFDFVFKGQKQNKLSDLKAQVRQHLGLKAEEKLELVKFQIRDFVWQVMNAEKLTGPHKLNDGDFIGYSVGDTGKDDYQTLEDQELRKKMLEARKQMGQGQGHSKQGQNEKGFGVNLQFMNE